jgi:hypothetical protein
MALERRYTLVSTTRSSATATHFDPTLSEPESRPVRWPALGAIGLGYMLASLGMGSISAILPTIAAELGRGGADDRPRPAGS